MLPQLEEVAAEDWRLRHRSVLDIKGGLGADVVLVVGPAMRSLEDSQFVNPRGRRSVSKMATKNGSLVVPGFNNFMIIMQIFHIPSGR